MKRAILILTAVIGITLLNSSFTTISINKPLVKKNKFTNINVTATNSTNDGVYVSLENNTSGGSYSFFIQPNTPDGAVIGQIPESSDSYTVKLTSTGGAHNMWVYWEHQSNVTRLSVSGMSIACQSCARIQIF
ncbi:hypothetical protein GJU39_00695 [Pedobacter petrophilus]|uniref:Uncharacterized protein n=1 Tax=Pedobacter petrophilus TaxID=1908241 RepID=A0A7K0FUG2_9SPHI|nr:hypothetical protein [Pedobacter petrophilus]MRX74589.1 hypothetical protein [Pedobacter petrophilus]